MVNKSGSDREHERLKLVRFLLETEFDKKKEFQDIVELAASLCEKPVALITLLDEHHNWIKVRIGVDHEVMPHETSFCRYAIDEDELMIVPDATKDLRFHENVLVKFDPGVRFYAGVPLALNNGYKLGTLCLFDLKPNDLSEIQKTALTVLARQVVFMLELEIRDKLLKKQMDEIQSKNESLVKIAYIQSHDIRQPLTTIMALVSLVKNGYQEVDEEWIAMMS
ncbi:GAF domain-containing protein [Dyadobacter sp. Leaf189]|uniref:GAF domain-containing protein n=1 Tax=Dyadobacter sp. Leaf189 TaxID=1736295 RepID=UPI00138F383C|nr:GAF domain-containing protein [Dyadobacter sp. Leaf189]